MARDWYINGPSMVSVKGATDTSIDTLTELGLTTDQISVSPTWKQSDMEVNAWWGAPPEVQIQLAMVTITCNLINIDYAILQECIRLSQGGSSAEGTLAIAGALLGNGKARFEAGNNLIGLNISSPVEENPWRFLYCHLTSQPLQVDLGSEKSIWRTQWRCIPYDVDIYNNGSGSDGYVLYDHTADT